MPDPSAPSSTAAAAGPTVPALATGISGSGGGGLSSKSPATPASFFPSTPLSATAGVGNGGPAGHGAGGNAGSAYSGPRSSSVAVGLSEAALDSPSFRANAANFNDQIELIERWLDSYAKSTAKMVHDFLGFEETVNQHLAKLSPPPGVGDGLIDADHTLLAMKLVSDGSRSWWTQVLSTVRRLDTVNAEPVRQLLGGELRAFKETRRTLEQAQKTYDATLARYVSQSKTKEPSALREDAFSVYEMRRAYLKASMDYCQMAPQLRCSLDKLLTRISADFWGEMQRARDATAGAMQWTSEMERIRGWSKELEATESALRRELQLSRRAIGESTLATIKPSRELDDYSSSTVAYLGSRGPSLGVRAAGGRSAVLGTHPAAMLSENQGWLFLRVVSGKPARVSWVRRWFYCRDGMFGYLVQGPHGVLQGDDIGVLLCSAKPAVQEERRFCFEVKTKSLNMMLQAETQSQLTEWLEVFEVAKKRAFETSMARDNASLPPGSIDPAFAITPPSVAEFSARVLDHVLSPSSTAVSVAAGNDETGSSGAAASTLALPSSLSPEAGLVTRGSFDITGIAPPRRSITMLGQELRREDGESSREHATRIMQRLDLHRKTTFSSSTITETANGVNSNGSSANGNGSGLSPGNGALAGGGGGGFGTGAGGLEHGHFYPAGPPLSPLPRLATYPQHLSAEPYRGSLAPTTFVKPPVLTFLSKIAMTVGKDRVLNRPDALACLPAGVQANYWGSNLWGRAFVASGSESPRGGGMLSPSLAAAETGSTGNGGASGRNTPRAAGPTSPASPTSASGMSGHRKTQSVDATQAHSDMRAFDWQAAESFPLRYPRELQAQHPQFRLLFPSVPLSEKLVLVFNAAWSSVSGEAGQEGQEGREGREGNADQQLVGSGRVYVTAENMYFYSQTMGLVVTYAVSLDIIAEVTAAPGRDCDYVFLQLGQDNMNQTGLTRITIKTFLEDMYLLQARLNLLIDDLQAEEPMDLVDMVSALQSLDADDAAIKSPSIESWDDGNSPVVAHDGGIRSFSHPHALHHSGKDGRGWGSSPGRSQMAARRRPGGRAGLAGRSVSKVQLPTSPVEYEPEGMRKVAERHFEISAKVCFHVMFGDKSFIFPKLYAERRARDITQGPWTLVDEGRMRRQFRFRVDGADLLGRRKEIEVTDTQTIEVYKDHVTYVVAHERTAWHLPHAQLFRVVIRVVITHVTKSKCKLAEYTQLTWSRAPPFSRRLIERPALDDAGRDAEEVAEIATDEVRRLGAHSRTKRAIQVCGGIGQQTQVVPYEPDAQGQQAGGSGTNGKKTGTQQQPKIRPRTLMEMLLETLRSFMESVASSLVMWAIAGLRQLFNIVTAHRLLLLVLGLSLATNVLFSSRETAAWWTERHALQFMTRMGVGPNTVMSRSVYLADLEEAARGWGGGGVGDSSSNNNSSSSSACYHTFRAMVNTTDLDAPADEAGALLSSSSSRIAAARLRRGRQRLGVYRHDLLVAMRIVNSVEREMMQSEWETWLADENVRCERVQSVLNARERERARQSDQTDQTDQTSQTDNGGRAAVLAQWHETYCGSCRAEQLALERAAWRQSFV